MATNKNIVLVTVDCLRADHLGCHGYPRPTSPFLDRLSGESFWFRNGIAAGIPTYYSFPSIMASRYPLGLSRDIVGLAPGENTLATAAHDAGYRTAAFVAGNPYLTPRNHYHQGFDQYEDFLSANQQAKDASGNETTSSEANPSQGRRILESVGSAAARWTPTQRLYDEVLFHLWARRSEKRHWTMEALRRYPAADQVVARAAHWLERTEPTEDSPFFLWVHLMDPHHPYHPPEKAFELLGRDPISPHRSLVLNAIWGRDDFSSARHARARHEILDLYDAGICWVDAQMETLANHLQSLGLWQNTVFAMTADHGEEFLEHGGRYHYPRKLAQELTHVPLMIRNPSANGHAMDTPFSLLDLAPTLLKMAGVSVPHSFEGQNRWSQEELRNPQTPVFTECVYDRCNPWKPGDESGHRLLAVRQGNHKLVVNFATGEELLFDLANDPGEQSPLPQEEKHGARPDLLRAMAQHLERQRPDLTSDNAQLLRLADLRHTIQKDLL